MIPKKIHQIYFNLHGKDISEIPLFEASSQKIQKMYPDYEYTLWNEKSCERVVQEHLPEQLEFYKNLRFEIQKIDYMRFVLLYVFGGVYVDLDLLPIKKIDSLLNPPFFSYSLKGLIPKHNEFIQNDFMGSVRGFALWKHVIELCPKNYKEKEGIDVYASWKARFVLNTTGPRFLSKIIKKVMPKYKPSEKLVYTKWKNENWKKVNRDDYFFENYVSGGWLPVITNYKAGKNFNLKKNEI